MGEWMPKIGVGLALALPAIAIGAAIAPPAQAQSLADFYRGKQVSLYIGFSPGGTYDLYARTIARHLGKHLPGNPLVITRNMEGAGSIRLTNYMYQQAPKDGTALATIGRGGAFGPLFGMGNATFDAEKFLWVGSANDEVSLCGSWHTSGIATIDDLKHKELIIAATGPTDESVTVPKMLNGVVGTKFKIVGGYPGSNEMTLAIERGEVQGRCALSWGSMKSMYKAWLTEKKINILVQLSYAKHPELADVPLASDLAKTEEDRQIIKLFAARQVMGRPYFAPPGLPPDRAEALRKAFLDTLKDQEFLAEADKVGLEIVPVPGQRVQDIVSDIYRTPPAVVQKAAALIN
jgi:tripartite-type tricarboxylate transporter receptor subunit TctC